MNEICTKRIFFSFFVLDIHFEVFRTVISHCKFSIHSTVLKTEDIIIMKRNPLFLVIYCCITVRVRKSCRAKAVMPMADLLPIKLCKIMSNCLLGLAYTNEYVPSLQTDDSNCPSIKFA